MWGHTPKWWSPLPLPRDSVLLAPVLTRSETLEGLPEPSEHRQGWQSHAAHFTGDKTKAQQGQLWSQVDCAWEMRVRNVPQSVCGKEQPAGQANAERGLLAWAIFKKGHWVLIAGCPFLWVGGLQRRGADHGSSQWLCRSPGPAHPTPASVQGLHHPRGGKGELTREEAAREPRSLQRPREGGRGGARQEEAETSPAERKTGPHSLGRR